MYPTIKLEQLFSPEWSAALLWVGIYYSREVTAAQKFGADIRPLNPLIWGKHDRVQTVYLAITAAVFAYLYFVATGN